MAEGAKPGLHAYAVPAVRVILGGILFYAGFSKLADIPGFARDIGHFRILPGVLERALAIVLPWNEVVVGALLIFGIWTRAAALLSIAFFALFAGAVASAMARGINIACGCFGSSTATRVGGEKLAEDAALLVLAVYLFLKSAPSRSKRAKWK